MNALNTTTPRPELFASVTSSDTEGLLDVNVTSEVNNRPIDGAQVQITRDSDPEQIIEQTTTNSLGQIPELTLPAPPVDYSMEPGANKPYAEYTITITAPGSRQRCRDFFRGNSDSECFASSYFADNQR